MNEPLNIVQHLKASNQDRAVQIVRLEVALEEARHHAALWKKIGYKYKGDMFSLVFRVAEGLDKLLAKLETALPDDSSNIKEELSEMIEQRKLLHTITEDVHIFAQEFMNEAAPLFPSVVQNSEENSGNGLFKIVKRKGGELLSD